ncbi:MAG: glutamate racemase [Patescibacteria group bacterium]
MSKKNNQPIGVFDSGVGGLSILIELKKKLPNEDFVFLADQKYVPYGEKTKEELITLVYKITDYFIKNHNIKMMVVACNTATCGAIEELRSKYSIPIVGTVPAVKLAAKKSKSGTVAVISTPSTSKSYRLKNIIKDFCQNVDVINIGCKNLEDTVEHGELESTEINKLLLKYLDKVKNSKTDYLVLGCTHYPFLKKSIRKILGSHIKLIDGGKAIARRTKWLLKNNSIKNNQKKRGSVVYFTTSDSEKFSKVASKLMKENIKAQNVKI